MLTTPVIHSLLFAGTTSALATVAGFIAFVGMTSLRGRGRGMFLATAVAILLLPPFAQAGAWWRLGMKWALPIATLPFGAAVLALQLWPITTLLLLASLQTLDPSPLEAARLSLSPRVTWMRVILPSLLPTLTLAFLLTFILALNQFLIPATFQTPLQITEVYMMFSSLYDTRRALLASVPLWLVSLAGLGFAGWLARRWEVARAGRHAPRETGPEALLPVPRRRIVQAFLVALACASLLPPLAHLIPMMHPAGILSAWRLAIPHLLSSLTYAVGAGLLASLLGLGLAWMTGYRSHPILEAILATPFILSGLFLGILMIMAGQWAGGAAWWPGGIFAGIVVLTLRFAWIPFQSVRAAWSRMPSELLDAARIHRLPRLTAFRHVHWPVVRAPLLAAAWLVYILALWDVETLLLVYPAGGEPVSLRIFQLLHYGYDSHVGALSLLLLLLGILPGALGLGRLRT